MGTAVTDTGLAHLAGLTGLTRLGLDQTQVTDDGVAKLRRSLPATIITITTAR
jgi:hypothetical protein